MIVVSSLKDLAAHDVTGIAVACGVFDGVHRGHQLVMKRLRRLARRLDAVPVVLTFDPHPRKVLDPAGAPSLLTTTQQKLCLLERFGAQAAVVMTFTPELAQLAPQVFLREHLVPAGVDVKGICVGEGWRFGARGAGDVAFLHRAGEALGFEVASVPQVSWYGKPVSSTRIRELLGAGRLRAAERLLGRPYAVFGSVVPGKGLGGKELGCPTANLSVGDLLLPPDGVYAVCTGWRCCAPPPQSRPRDGIAYIGNAPTVSSSRPERPPVLEVHLFDVSGDFYGHDLEVEFLDFLRTDRRFPTLQALARQVKADIADAKRVCAEHARRRRMRVE
jgi:riboflavin kinase/FMN adenylyltransferase